jgi:H+/Cl- antiporter ClcA
VATAVALLVLPDEPTYLVPAFDSSPSLIVWSLLAGPLAGLVGAGFSRLTRLAREIAPEGARLPLVTVPVFTALGAVAMVLPQLLGNGRGPAQLAFDATLGLPVLLLLLVLKPVATAACLAAGARGGLLTPALATGALLGGAAGLLWTQMWPGAQLGAYAIVGAAAVLAAVFQAPVTAIVLVLEFTWSGPRLLVPVVLAAGASVAVARRLGS